ncbi:MAG: DUF3526 domain-containing protein [Gemmatimonadetes bacterium]|nr:DUF3526 domain-containing protein [Gemmatimonadota bacterium]
MRFRHHVRHEWRLLRADRLLTATLGLFAVLFLYALLNGSAWVRFQEDTLGALAEARDERDARTRAELRRIASGGQPSSPFRDPRAPNVLGSQRNSRPAALPPGPLATLAIGQSDLLPFYYDVSIYTNDQTFLQNGEVENPLHLLVGRFDLAFVLVYLLPLLVLALSYNVLSGERERGTLPMTLAQPVSARSTLGVKLVFRVIVVLFLALGVSVVGGLATGVRDVGRLALWSTIVTSYAIFWLGLATWVNSRGRSSAWNATVLVGAWLLLVVVFPAAVNVAAGLLHPLPSRVEMITVQREASNEAVNRRSELLARYLEDHPEMSGAVVSEASSSAALAWAATEEVNRRLGEVVERYQGRLEEQRRLIGTYRYASPALLAHDALLETAGTGDGRFSRFEAQVRGFAQELKDFFVPAILAGDRMTEAVVADIPSFRYREAGFQTVVGRIVPALAALLAMTLLVSVPGWRAMRDVRGTS